MNYLLVMPKKLSTGANTTSIIFPLGIAYVSAALKQAGFAVFTANLDFPEGDTFSVLQRMMLDNDIHVVCTGGLSLDCHKIKDVIDSARRINQQIITVVGGGIISSDPETAMNVLGADIGVIGEGEVTLCELASALDSGETYANVPGLIYRGSDRKLVTTPARMEIADLDSIPFPDYDGFNYGQWVTYFGGAGVLLSDRSCPFRCTFCFHPTGEKYRQRSLENIFAEIEFQKTHFQLTSIGLTSELFATTRKRILDFCAGIRGYNLAWSCCLRVTDVDAELLQQMKEAGCNLVCYGLESGDDSILKSMRKGITVDQIERALDLSYAAGISTEASNFIFGDIAENAETVANTMKLWWKYNNKTHINLSLIQTYPGTHLYEHACWNGIISDKEQFLRDGCPIVNVSRLSSAEFHDLTSLITEMRMHPHVPAESVRILDISEDGQCTTEFVCRKCRTSNRAVVWFWFTEICHCAACGIKNEVAPFRGATVNQSRFFDNLPGDGAVVLWGAGGIYYKLMQQVSGLAGERFQLVDANPEQQGLVICKKIVHPPELIASSGITTVIITALSRQHEIHATLVERFPSVNMILIPSFRLTTNGIVPFLEPFGPDAVPGATP
ncbi:MAG: radical SAM protein [Desulfuromonadales bacterium]|nr:radical SAM protein [Desulfuromonadales bacterium]